MSIYEKSVSEADVSTEIVETDIDLYYHMAVNMYTAIERNNAAGKNTVFILPVGPVFQYRRFIFLLRNRPLDLSRLYCFFMDEYLDEKGRLISEEDSLSFRGFIKRELLDPMPAEMNFQRSQVFFPDPRNPGEYDRKLEELGHADICFAGVGINGHLAFNEPPSPEEGVTAEEFRNLGTRTLTLTRETITINSNTALRGAYELIPTRAITVGFRQIMNAKQLLIYLNRPWQNSVVRKLLFGEKTPLFPASLARDHADLHVTMTAEVAKTPDFALK